MNQSARPSTTSPSTTSPFLTLLSSCLDRSRERFDRALAGVSAEQANARPVDALAPRIDSLTWLTWHTARAIDLQVSALAGSEPLWTSEGFTHRFALPLPDDTEDWRHSPAESSAVRVDDLGLLTDYLDAAYALLRSYLSALDPSTLDDVVDRTWDPPVTRGVRLASIIDDTAQHSGQAVYARRLLGLAG